MRATRVKRGWRQSDLSGKARVSASVVSLIERGHLERVSVSSFRRVAAALELRTEISVWMPHGELERLLNAGHAALHEAIARYLASLGGWEHAPEVSFAVYGERGVIDILAFHPATGSLLVIELKTELVSLEDLLGKMDVRIRHAVKIARDRGWAATSVSAWVILSDTRTNRRRASAHRAVLRSALPSDGHALRSWMIRPRGPIRALSFWTSSRLPTLSQRPHGLRRVRRHGSGGGPGQTAA